MIFQFDLEPFLNQRILIGFEAILKITFLDGSMRAWTVKLTPSSLLQTRSILSTAMTKVKDYNWDVALNINIINLNIFHEGILHINTNLIDKKKYSFIIH